jgi:hypothetical protein
LAYDAAKGAHGLPLLAAMALKIAGRIIPGTPAKNSALAEALTAQGAVKDSIGAAIGDLLARRAAGRAAGANIAPVFAGVGLGNFGR